MENLSKNNRKTDIGIIVLIFSIIGIIAGFFFWLPHSNIPSKKVKFFEYNDANRGSIDGSINSNNIWKNYYRKTPSEVVSFAPQFVSLNKNMYLLDSRPIDSFPTLPTNLIGIFENGKIEMLSLFYQISDGSLCFMKCRDDLSCIDKKALEIIIDLSMIYLHQFGLLSEDDHEIDIDRSQSDSANKDYQIFVLKSGVNCIAPTCPGSTVSLMCGIKSGDELFQQTKLLKASLDS